MSKNQVLSNVSLFKSDKVVSHAFSPDGQYIAISLKNSNSVRIFQIGSNLLDVNSYQPKWILKEQSMKVSVLDWSVKNKILMGSFDKSLLVYEFNNGNWEKGLAVAWNSRSILDGCWSPNGEKFAVGTGCYKTMVGYYNTLSQWWSTMELLKCKSSVLQVRWHPSGRIIGVGSADFTVTLVTAVVTQNPELEDQSYKGPFDKIDSQSQVIFKLTSESWVNCLAFSPSGYRFAFALHSGVLQFANIVRGDEDSLEFQDNSQFTPPALPMNAIEFLTDDKLLAAGFDRKPALLSLSADGWEWKEFLTANLNGSAKGNTSMIKNRMAAFQKQSSTVVKEEENFLHPTPITCLRRVINKNGVYSTSDVNGIINFWAVK